MSTPSTPLLPLSAAAKAAWIVDETLRGNAVPSLASIPQSADVRARHLRYESHAPIRSAAACALIALAFFEYPSWCGRSGPCVAPNGASGAALYMSGVAHLHPGVSSGLEFLALAILTAYLLEIRAICASEEPNSNNNTSFAHHAALLAVLVLDAAITLLVPAYYFYRPGPVLRAFLPLFYSRPLLQTARGIRALVRPFLDVLLFWVLFCLGCGWVCTLLFHDMPGTERYWRDLPTGLLSSFIIATGADYPMQIVAVYESHRAYVFFFVAQVIVGIFILFNFVLAVVYNAYTSKIEDDVLARARMKRDNLDLAFQLISAEDEHGEGLTLEGFKPLVAELRKNPTIDVSDNQLRLLYLALDDDGDQVISKEEFSDIIDSLELQFEIYTKDQASFVERCLPSLYQMPWWSDLMVYVRSPKFERFIDIFMLTNVLVVLFESTLDLKDLDTPASVFFFAVLELAFSAVYVMEAALKVAAMSWRKYWSFAGNRYDFVVMLFLFAGAIWILLPFEDNSPELIRYLVALRCLRLVALLADIPRFADLVRIFSMLLPASIPLLVFFFLALYVFSAIGVQLFGGLIYDGNPALDENVHELVDAFKMNQYMSLNLNDMASAWFMLFTSVVVCYLTEVPAAIASASAAGDWAHWFFLIAFAVNTLVISNVVLALVVDLFVDAKDRTSKEGEDAQELAILHERYAASELGWAHVSITRRAATAHTVFSRTVFRDQIARVAGRS